MIQRIWVFAVASVAVAVVLQLRKAQSQALDLRVYREDIRPKIFVSGLLIGGIFLAMGVLLESNLVPSVEQFFEFHIKNPYIALWNGLILIELLVLLAWIWFGGGDDFLSRNAFLLNLPIGSLTKSRVRIGGLCMLLFFLLSFVCRMLLLRI